MLIKETFTSIQGEGKLIGVPSIFIRTVGCNLHCKWCDTKYALNTKGVERIPVIELVKSISDYPKTYRHVVITGGEPMLQDEIQMLCKMLKEALDLHITIETNGTIYKEPIEFDLLSLSPKLSNSAPSIGSRYYSSHVTKSQFIPTYDNWLEYCLKTKRDYQIKFVVGSSDDLDGLNQDLDEINWHWLNNSTKHNDHVMLMPQSMDTPDIIDKTKDLVETCKTQGFRLAPRLHTMLWGCRKGV